MKTAETFQTTLAVCVNKYDVSPEHTAEIENFCRDQGIHFVGRIPFDPMAAKAANEGFSVVDVDCPAGRAVRGIYREVCKILELKTRIMIKRRLHYENRGIL